MVELLAHIMGSYAHTTDGSLFRKNSNDADANPKLYALMGKRLVIASEVDHGHFDDIMIKQLTGDSHITTRALYQNVVTFPRTFKIIAVGNSIPSSSETSRALEARLHSARGPAAESGGIRQENIRSHPSVTPPAGSSR